MEYVSPSGLRPIYKDPALIVATIITFILAIYFEVGKDILFTAVIAIFLVRGFVFPPPSEMYNITQQGIKIQRGKKTIDIPFQKIDEANLRSFKHKPRYNAITIRYSKESVELAFGNDDEKEARDFFDQIKNQIGDKANDYVRGDINWKLVLKKFAITVAVVFVICLVAPPMLFVVVALSPFLVPLWFFALDWAGHFREKKEL